MGREFKQTKLRRAAFSASRATGVIVLPRLSREREMGGEFFLFHVVGVAAKKRVAYVEENALPLLKDLPFRQDEQRVFFHAEPLFVGLRRAGSAEELFVKAFRDQYAAAIPSRGSKQRPLVPQKLFRKFRIRAFQFKSERFVVFFVDPKTKKATRVGYVSEKGKKVRVTKASGSKLN